MARQCSSGRWQQRQQRLALAAALAVVALASWAAAPAAAAEPPEFSTLYSNIANMQTAEGRIGDVLGKALNGWEFTLPLEFVRKGQAYVGPSTRLRRVLSDMQAGKPVSVTVLGGSISTGAVASRKQAATDPNDLWSFVRLYLQQNVDGSVTFSNNARSATKSYITSLCLDKFLDETSDLVFVEFIANDGSEMDVSYLDNQKARFFERFLRKILSRPSAPAVVMMQFPTNEMAYPAGGMYNKPKRPYQASPEDTYYNLAQYYDVPTLSFRYAMYTLGESGRDGWGWDAIMGADRLHPSDKGHRVSADLVIYLLQQTLVGLQIHPAGSAERASRSAPLPPPMYGGNEVGSSEPVCAMGKNLTKYIASDDGWQLVHGGDGTDPIYPTDGYETRTKGAPLSLQVDTTTPDGRPATIYLVYTKAKSGMGVAEVTCANGCKCAPTFLDSSITYDQVVTYIDGIKPSAAPKCRINVALAGNSTDGSKLRLSGVAVTSDPGLLSNARIGEDKYMAWLLGDNWAA